MKPAGRERPPAQIEIDTFDAIFDLRDGELLIDRIPGAVQVDPSELDRIERLVPDRSSAILVYCGIGEQSRNAAKALQQLGYPNVITLAGGIRRWRSEGRQVVSVETADTDRYDRHVRLSGIGEEGQRRIRQARVAVVGAGGLGSPVVQYLASAGIGNLGIIDGDRVEVTNLQRQVLFDSNDLGLMKALAAKARVRELNPDVAVAPIPKWLDADNASELLGGYDLIVDASDNYATRLTVNDTAAHLGAPFVHGAAIRWEGMVAAFDPRVGPCYRCLFPNLPEHEETCSDVGVLGAITGVVGSLMAVEAIKHVVGSPDRMVDRLVTFDARSARFTSLKIERSDACPIHR